MKVLFIIPYYGKLPCYFPAWLISAKAQKNIDFLLITDLFTEESDNIKILNWSFEQTRQYIQTKFDFKISLERPYKFCDYKPAYGYIFEEFLKGYDFWGHCDIDTIFGDLYSFLQEPLEKYDAIGRWGHLSLYKNATGINRLFMSDKGLFNYKEVFSNDYSYAFDETSGMKMIVSKTEDLKYLFELEKMADLSKKHKDLMGGHNFINHSKQIFFYENGKLFQCYIDNNALKYNEIMYLHFQWKKPAIKFELSDSFYIFYNEFISRTSRANDKAVLKKFSFYKLSIYKMYENTVYVVNQIVKLLKMKKKQRKINNSKRNITICIN